MPFSTRASSTRCEQTTPLSDVHVLAHALGVDQHALHDVGEHCQGVVEGKA